MLVWVFSEECNDSLSHKRRNVVHFLSLESQDRKSGKLESRVFGRQSMAFADGRGKPYQAGLPGRPYLASVVPQAVGQKWASYFVSTANTGSKGASLAASRCSARVRSQLVGPSAVPSVACIARQASRQSAARSS